MVDGDHAPAHGSEDAGERIEIGAIAGQAGDADHRAAGRLPGIRCMVTRVQAQAIVATDPLVTMQASDLTVHEWITR
ncbi:hypothetical protein G6F63_015963 [Rhizopus arrhizus]|nr:hypothetical protein G6F63_015963 [Rhizopus arrhizus]